MAAEKRRVTANDRARLRELAARVRAVADSDANQELIRLWHKHDENRGERPLVLTETDGGLQMVMPHVPIMCEEPWAQGQEWGLISALAHVEFLKDDSPVEPFINVGWRTWGTGWGVEIHKTRPDTGGSLGAYHIDPPIKDLEKEIGRLKPQTWSVDREGSLADRALLEEVYDGILGVRMRGNSWWSLGLTWAAIDLIGLDMLMIYMYEQPEALHGLMAFLRDDALAFTGWLQAEGLLSLNNANDYTGSGSRGYTQALPQPDLADGDPVRRKDLWTLLESQETVGVGPKQFEEFVFPYQDSIARHFGRVYYGCCEPVNNRWHIVKRIENLKRVSVSPWCDEAFMAEACGTSFVYSRKPAPSLISTAQFDEEAILADLRNTLRLTSAHGCTVEFAMKDVHTLHGEPHRLPRWVQLARQAIGEVYS